MTEVHLRPYDEATTYIRGLLDEDPSEELVQMNVLCKRSTLEQRNRLAEELGWTQRKVSEAAIDLFEMVLKEAR